MNVKSLQFCVPNIPWTCPFVFLHNSGAFIRASLSSRLTAGISSPLTYHSIMPMLIHWPNLSFENTGQIMLFLCLMPFIFFPTLYRIRFKWVIMKNDYAFCDYTSANFAAFISCLVPILTFCALAMLDSLNFPKCTMFFYSSLSLHIKSGTVPEHPFLYFRSCGFPEIQVNVKKQRLLEFLES